VKAVVSVDELPGGSLEFPDDVNDPGNGPPATGSAGPGPLPEEVRASDRARESRRERSRARGPAQRSTATSPAATVTPSNAGSAPSAYERTATAIPSAASSDNAKAFPETGSDRAGGGAPARVSSSSASRPWRPSRRRSPPALPRGPVRSVHDTGSPSPAPAPGPSPPSLVPVEEAGELLLPEILRLVGIHEDPVEVGEVAVLPGGFGDIPVQVA